MYTIPSPAGGGPAMKTRIVCMCERACVCVWLARKANFHLLQGERPFVHKGEQQHVGMIDINFRLPEETELIFATYANRICILKLVSISY